ncbi:MAG TPA: formate dehydrogenase [Chloroflexi bacterium]|nr:formate dehydrogenase [Chloroflexota bacterium]
MRAVIPVENNVLGAVRGFLKQLLEEEVVEAVLVPVETPAGTITPALVANAELLDAADPLAPVMGLNAARVAGPVSVREPRGRIAVVLRPCELRALVELVKLQQVSLDDLVTVAVDCLGTYTVPDYEAMRANGGVDRAALLATAQSGDLVPQEGYTFRDACQMCEKPYAEGADIVLELFGADLSAGIPVTLADEIAERLSSFLSSPLGGEEGGEQGADPSASLRTEVVEKVVAARTEVRDARFAEIRERLDKEGIAGVFAACVRCHNCMTVCPICYCKTCLFKSPVFDHEPAQYMNWAQRKGAYRLPADTVLFHLTRLNHMVLSCIGCGVCTDGCPAELPVGRVFRVIGQDLQAVFEYVPGRSVEEPLPLVTFREDEWTEVGEE